MTRIHLAAAVLTLVASPVCAQAVDGGGVPFRLWDVSAGVGLHFERDRGTYAAAGDQYERWRATGAVAAQTGRYWTSHVKTEIGVLHLGTDEGFGSEAVTVPGSGTRYTYYRTFTRVTHVSVAQSYQFFDNVFAHPYVSAGARLGVGDFRATRDPYVDSGRSGAPSIPAVERHEQVVRVRPFAAAGFKSYFNERTFIRSELSMAFDGEGLEHVAIGLGFGVDF
jgi:hypothetical protein